MKTNVSRPTTRSMLAVRFTGLFIVFVAGASLSCHVMDPQEPTTVPETYRPVETTTVGSGETIKIGTVLPSTGALSLTGPNSELAIALAFDLINEAGGVNGKRIEVINRDSGTSEQLGTDAASGLINIHDVPVILGAVSSGVTVAIAESVTVPSGVLLVSPISSSNAITALDDNDMVFRTSVSDAVKSEVAARLARSLGYDTVSTSYVNNAFGVSLSNGFTDHFETLGGTVTDQVSHELGQTSYTSELRKASEYDPEALVAIAYTDTAYTLLREAAEGGYFENYIFFSPLYTQELFDTIGVQNFEGAYGVTPGAPLTDARQWFFNEFAERKNGDIGFPLISESFDAAMIVALAIEHADSEHPAAIRDALRAVANPPGRKVGPQEIELALQLIREGVDVDYVGASGEADFDENGDVSGSMEIWRISDGVVESAGIFAQPGEVIDLR